MEIHLNIELSSGLGRIWGWASCPVSECGTSAAQKEEKKTARSGPRSRGGGWARAGEMAAENKPEGRFPKCILRNARLLRSQHRATYGRRSREEQQSRKNLFTEKVA